VLLLEGLVDIAAGVITLSNPGLATLVFIYVIAFWAIITGILEIAAAINLRKEVQGEFLLGLSGIVSIALGFLLLITSPAVDALTVTWLIGGYAIAFGVMLIALGLRLKSQGPDPKESTL